MSSNLSVVNNMLWNSEINLKTLEHFFFPFFVQFYFLLITWETVLDVMENIVSHLLTTLAPIVQNYTLYFESVMNATNASLG